MRTSKPKTRGDLHAHARKRVLERFGLQLNSHDFRAIVERIRQQHPDCKFLSKRSLCRSVWKVAYQGQVLIAVFDKKRAAIATVMTCAMYFGSSAGEEEESNYDNPASAKAVRKAQR